MGTGKGRGAQADSGTPTPIMAAGNALRVIFTSWPEGTRGRWHIWSGQEMVVETEVAEASHAHPE
eukprot:7639239-Prorocentrum_lima.AAC.1